MEILSTEFLSALLAIVVIDLVLAWTAAQMMLHEPMLTPHLQDRDLLRAATYLVVIAGVLVASFLAGRWRRRASA